MRAGLRRGPCRAIVAGGGRGHAEEGDAAQAEQLAKKNADAPFGSAPKKAVALDPNDPALSSMVQQQENDLAKMADAAARRKTKASVLAQRMEDLRIEREAEEEERQFAFQEREAALEREVEERRQHLEVERQLCVPIHPSPQHIPALRLSARVGVSRKFVPRTLRLRSSDLLDPQ